MGMRFKHTKNVVAFVAFTLMMNSDEISTCYSFCPLAPRSPSVRPGRSSMALCLWRKPSSVESANAPKVVIPKEAITPVSDHAMWTLLPSMFEKQSNGRASNADVRTYTGYVPAGLTKEQYLAMRQKERRTEEKKDYATWGPRFATTERPDGDWMVQPSLWRNGFVANSPYKEEQSYTAKTTRKDRKEQHTSVSARQYATKLMLYYLPVALLSMVSLQLVSLTNAIKAQQNLASFNVSRRFFALSKWTKSLPWVRNIVISLSISPILDRFMARTLNRKLQWSRYQCLKTWNVVNLAIGLALLGSRFAV